MEEKQRNEQIGRLAVSMLRTVPVLYRRVIRKNEMQDPELAYPKISVLATLRTYGPMPISTLAKFNSYSKQNLTTMIDRLEADGLVKRVPDANDRRVINIEITEAGFDYIKINGKRMKESLVQDLQDMDDSDIEALKDSFETIESIFLKFAKTQNICNN
jgi:DNA-binding MarR family transcriptional regulator